MSFNFIATGGSIKTSDLCLYDSNVGYESDFSIDGEVDGWTLYDGIHTYGCWNNFLFGTLYGNTSLIGRHYNFIEVETEDFYTVKIVMKLNIKERIGTQKIPTYGRLSWITVADPNWSISKSVDFDLNLEGDWYNYYINMGEVQEWQGNVFNLRINPILQDGRDGDEFFIRAIKILSTDTYRCKNGGCSYYVNYQHPCSGVGKRGTCSSKHLDYLVEEGSTFVLASDQLYTIKEDINDIFIVNINGYGDESIKFPPTTNATGSEIAYILTKEISKINVGGYSEVEVEYNSVGQFVIYSGTYVDDSVVTVGNSSAAINFNFYDENGIYQSTETVGECPVSGYRSFSSFKISTNQILRLFDSNDDSGFLFSPFIYNIEGGRRDWLASGLGDPSKDVRGQEDDHSRMMNRSYDRIDNANKTIIDFNHPFNASGRINKIYAAVTLDNYEDSFDSRGLYDSGRIDTQLSGALIMFFRPLKDGTIKVLDTTLPIENRDHASGNLYSATQEYVEIDCDIFVNKGDLIGVYNANVYKGQSLGGIETDAMFYQVSGKAEGVLKVNTPEGDGSAGLLLYARSDQIQSRLVIDIDLSRRVNVEGVDVIGTVINEELEYNIARCLDVNWEIDLFGEDHTTAWVHRTRPYVAGFYNHPNIFYGKNCLTDGIKTVSDGLASKSFSIDLQTYHFSSDTSINYWHGKDGGAGIVVTDPQYFHVNGDSEWLLSYLLAGYWAPFAVNNFKRDPIAFTLICPAGKKKMLSKLRIYFKERYNFRSFALSFFKGDYYTIGNADIPTFNLIPNRSDGFDTPWSRVILDDTECVPENEELWSRLSLYLGTNPIIGHEIINITSITPDKKEHMMEYFSSHAGSGYYATGTVTNNEQNYQALVTDWTTLTIEWPPFEELGFRLYCDYHESTKICEMELFCSVLNVGSLMSGSVSVAYSEYGDSIWLSEIIQKADNHAYAFIEDTPRYITVEIDPIVDMTLQEVCVSISSEDVFLGEKGCQQQVFPIVAKTGSSGESFPVYFKNVYGKPYDLYVDIEAPISVDEGLIYYSKMNNEESILNPEVGADSYYKKGSHYDIRNDNYNVAINCPVYGLKNLVDGAEAWYSNDEGVSWYNFGTLSSDVNVDFSNLSDSDISVIHLPVLLRNRYWKIGWLAEDHPTSQIREIRLFYDDEMIPCDYYHDKNLNWEDGPISDTAPHLNNESVVGSYYELKYNQYIGFDLFGLNKIDKIMLFHTSLSTYCGSTCGIDKYTSLCLQGRGAHLSIDIVDYSYHEHDVELGVDVYSWVPASGTVLPVEGSNGSISFPGTRDGYVKVPYSKCLFVGGSEYTYPDYIYFSMDFWISCRSYPTHKIHLMAGTFSLTLEHVGGDQIRIAVLEMGTVATFSSPLGIWHRVYIKGHTMSGYGGRMQAYVDDVLSCDTFYETPIWGANFSDLVIGQSFDGWLAEVRYTVGNNSAIDSYYSFENQYERYYTMSVYSSWDNVTYGKYCDVDLMFENSYSYYFPANRFGGNYNSYFAIDLGHRYALDTIRSFPVDEACQFDLNTNVLYSNTETSDPNEAFKSLSVEDVNTDFNGGDRTLPKNWYIFDGGSENCIFNNKLYQSAKANCANLTAEFYLVNDFDLEIEYELINPLNTDSWSCGIFIQDMSNEDNSIRMNRVFDGSNKYSFDVKDNSSSWGTASSSLTSHRKASIKFVRANQIFTAYAKNLDVDIPEEYVMVGYYNMDGGFGNETLLSIITQSDLPNYPTISVEWDNLIFNSAEPICGTYNDTRWVKIKVLCGDGVIRVIKRVGIYSDISVQLSKGNNYNTDWIPLGESVTSYVGEQNIAVAVEVEASSYAGGMLPENVVNGLLTTDLDLSWGAKEGTPQWITVILPTDTLIYRVVVHLNYDGEDPDYLIQEYKIQVSTDNITFTTVFDISDNTSYCRTHDLIEPVTAKYIRVYITEYKASTKYIAFSDKHEYWAGATIRQIEIYEYYGFTVVDSETYPIIAVDLRQNYFITGHSMIGIDPDTTYTDWDNSDSNYTYSNSNLTEPKKVSFGYWGTVPDYERWVVVKRNTATHYPLVPDIYNPYRDTSDYLKHLIIKASVNEDNIKPNPVECHWMWNSNVSTLGYSYNYIRTDYTQRSLKIEYPESNQSDHVYFREGDNFGIDEDFSWRDGLSFGWYINDINDLDLDYGYIYFGGYDSTDAHNAVIYKWYLPTLSGILHSGWNDLALTMKAADLIEWVDTADSADPDPRILYSLTLQKLGMVFKGNGKAFNMYIDGFIIERNHFKDMSRFDRGLYIHGDDLLKINTGELDFASGTLEFFIRPDWKLAGGDIYNDFKLRSLFHFSNVANDVFGAILSTKGLEIYYGNLINEFELFIITDLGFDIIDIPTHVAFVFSNNGTGISNDGSTLRVYFNNGLVAKSIRTWNITDRKHFNFIFGGKNLLIQKRQGSITRASAVDGVVSNLKIYNYCKTDFSDSIGSSEITDKVVLTKPSELIEISKDNLIFYNIDSSELPFKYEDVLQEEIIPIYVRTSIPKGLSGKEIRTANLLGQWDIGV